MYVSPNYQLASAHITWKLCCVPVILCTIHNTLDVSHTLAAMITNDKTSGLPCLVVTLHTCCHGYGRG
jgi:hypothetical protein